MLRSSSCCSSNSGTAAMATRASSRGCLAVRGKKRLGRRRGAFQGRPRPRLRRPPCRTAAGGRWTPPPSQQPRARASGTPRAPPERPPPSPPPSILEPGKEATRGPTLAPRHADTGTARPGRGRGIRALSRRGAPREGAREAARGIYCSARVQDGDRR